MIFVPAFSSNLKQLELLSFRAAIFAFQLEEVLDDINVLESLNYAV